MPSGGRSRSKEHIRKKSRSRSRTRRSVSRNARPDMPSSSNLGHRMEYDKLLQLYDPDRINSLFRVLNVRYHPLIEEASDLADRLRQNPDDETAARNFMDLNLELNKMPDFRGMFDAMKGREFLPSMGYNNDRVTHTDRSLKWQRGLPELPPPKTGRPPKNSCATISWTPWKKSITLSRSSTPFRISPTRKNSKSSSRTSTI